METLSIARSNDRETPIRHRLTWSRDHHTHTLSIVSNLVDIVFHFSPRVPNVLALQQSAGQDITVDLYRVPCGLVIEDRSSSKLS